MQKTTFNYAFVISIMVLLVFAYFAFMGMVYWRDGEILTPILLSAALVILVVIIVFIMCRSKATRFVKKGVPLEIFSALIVLAVFLLASYPFTNFIRVIEDASKIEESVSNVINAAEKIDQEYADYVDNRVDAYKDALFIISKSKEISPSEYEKYLEHAGGINDEAKIASLSKSLHRRLLPDSAKNIIENRNEFLRQLKNISVWNPLTPKNIKTVNEQVEYWQGNYKELSSEVYDGEDNPKPFEYQQFKNKLEEWSTNYLTLRTPSVLSIIISVICALLMLLPYFITTRDIAHRGNNKIEYS